MYGLKCEKLNTHLKINALKNGQRVIYLTKQTLNKLYSLYNNAHFFWSYSIVSKITVVQNEYEIPVYVL